MPLLSRPSQSDSRDLAHNERVVGNGCHTASSTRTSHGVPALQGFTPSILHSAFWLSPPRATSACARRRISPVFPSHASFALRRPCLRIFGSSRIVISRSQSMGVAAESAWFLRTLPAGSLRTSAVFSFSLLSFLPLCNCQCLDGRLARLCVALP